MILPDDLYDYLGDRSRNGALRSHGDDRSLLPDIIVTDDWPERLRVTEAEVDIFERYFGDLLDELFGASNP